jgi:hypothetical protein
MSLYYVVCAIALLIAVLNLYIIFLNTFLTLEKIYQWLISWYNITNAINTARKKGNKF